MPNTLPEALLGRISTRVAEQMGLHFPRERWSDLERGLVSAARAFKFDELERCARWLLSSPLTKQQIEVLGSNLTIGETYFYRDRRYFEILENDVLPEIIRSRREDGRSIRIWSAGCCSGEEPYTIAVLLSRMIPDLADWNITILGTDINLRSIEKGSAGVYGEWSFRDTPSWIRENYFRKAESKRYQIEPHIRRMVVFS